MEKKEMEKFVMEYNLYGAKLQEMEQQLQAIEKFIVEIQTTSNALDELKDAKINQESLSPIGQGIFVKTKLGDNKEVMVEIGTKVVANKSIDEAKTLLDKKIMDLINLRKNLADQIEVIVIKMQQIEAGISGKNVHSP
jgi:prefoldin alpha subunit